MRAAGTAMVRRPACDLGGPSTMTPPGPRVSCSATSRVERCVPPARPLLSGDLTLCTDRWRKGTDLSGNHVGDPAVADRYRARCQRSYAGYRRPAAAHEAHHERTLEGSVQNLSIGREVRPGRRREPSNAERSVTRLVVRCSDTSTTSTRLARTRTPAHVPQHETRPSVPVSPARWKPVVLAFAMVLRRLPLGAHRRELPERRT
jgi:hypothetical protein